MTKVRILSHLKQPYPQQIKSWEMIIGASLLVFFVLGAFQPFGISSIHEHKLPILIGYMLVTALCLSIKAYLFPMIWKSYYKEEKWTLGKEILSTVQTVVYITFGNSLYASLYLSLQLSLFSIVFYLITTFLIAIFPITFLLFIRQNRLLSNSLKEITEMNNQINSSPKTFHSNEFVTFEGNSKDAVKVDINQLLYIEANGNYVNIHYIEDDKLKKKMLRTTIKQIEESLTDYPHIIRCHRAFIVNTSVIEHVKGNSQGYRLHFNGIEDEIPVSRAFLKKIKDQIGTATTEFKQVIHP